jgi:uncharacterized protein (DUF433 family)
MIDYRQHITIEAGKRGGQASVRGMRITVADVLGWLAEGLSHDDIMEDFPELTDDDIRAVLAYAAARQRRTVIATV